MIIRIITNYVVNFLILRLTFLIKNKKNHLNMEKYRSVKRGYLFFRHNLVFFFFHIVE